MIYFLMRLILEGFVRFWYKLEVSGSENIPKKPRGYIVACNHQKYYDPVVIAALIRRARFSFMAKAELFSGGRFFSALIRYCGAYPVERGAGDTGALDRGVADLVQGKVFVIFPEGTRSKTGEIGRGKAGVALIAGKANADVLPVCIMYGEKKRFKRHIKVAFGEIIPANEIQIADDDRRNLRRVSNAIMDKIKALQATLR